MTITLGYPRFKAFDTNGLPLAGGKLYSYQAGTNTLIPTYSDYLLTSANPNPVILNPEGEAVIYLSTITKLVLKDANGVTLWTMDNVSSLPASSVVNVTDYGAVGNGVTNDSPAIQAAIDAGKSEVYLPAITPNALNPGSVTSTNYYLSTSLVFTKPITFRMDANTSLVYAGSDAAITVDCHDAAIEGLTLELYDVYTAGDYCLKVIGNGVTLGTTAYVARARISAHRLAKFNVAGFYTKWCMFVENDVNILNMYPDSSTPNAIGYYFDDTGQVAGGYYQEANTLRTITVNSRRSLYAPGTLFDINQINIGTDYGSFTFDVTVDNMTIGGPDNLITIPFVVIPSAQSFRTTKLHLLSTAVRNKVVVPPVYLSGMVDEASAGANFYDTPQGGYNYLVNPSGETWTTAAAPYGWTLNCLAAANTTYVRHGKKSFAVTSNAGFGNMYQTLPTDLNNQYVTFSGWFMSPAGNTGAAAFGFSYTGGATSSLASLQNDGKWHFLSMSVDGTAGLTNFVAQIYADTGVVNQTIYADGLFVTLGSTPAMLPTMLQADEKTISGSFTCAAAASKTVAEINVTATSVITLEPTNAAAATLQGSAKCLYTSAKVAGTSFTVTTANGAAALGTETFNYRLVN